MTYSQRPGLPMYTTILPFHLLQDPRPILSAPFELSVSSFCTLCIRPLPPQAFTGRKYAPYMSLHLHQRVKCKLFFCSNCRQLSV
ncbi:hypothetical protein A4X06_0g3072 [Tilletia controversa]|uniref:Uncharacterized protein n=1 Tax=Tilletia controversa TaxID=13291 RepID=A0A8X7MV60_9BASI|nr:hypothetical protein CF328_g2370 [Tilletia controversa]KAE8249787.1 hypothetical protein A4X06_0g3072 [Tilletia controversa]